MVRFAVFYYFLLLLGFCWHVLAAAGTCWQTLIPAHLRFPQTTGRSMGLANKSVVLYESIKVGKRWYFRAVDEDASHFSNGPFYVSWYDGKKKQMEPAGRDPEHALRMVTLKRAALAYVSAGGELTIRNPVQKSSGDLSREDAKNAEQNQKPSEGTKGEVSPDAKSPEDRKKVSTAITEYLEDCLDRQGKSGYGLASRTHETYTYRLGFLAKFRPKAFLDEIDDQFVKGFRRFLREQPNLSDRTSYNIMQAVSTFLLRNGIGVAKPILKEMSFPPTEVIPYSGYAGLLQRLR
jgi:hypothetical protein